MTEHWATLASPGACYVGEAQISIPAFVRRSPSRSGLNTIPHLHQAVGDPFREEIVMSASRNSSHKLAATIVTQRTLERGNEAFRGTR